MLGGHRIGAGQSIVCIYARTITSASNLVMVSEITKRWLAQWN
jgi:hypothetical protein